MAIYPQIDPQKCFQVTGPPGTGKTTWLAKQARVAMEKYGPAKLVIASLTRAAAYEFSSRGLSAIPSEQIGTLHMICRRALGSPEIADGDTHIRQWNEHVMRLQKPRFVLSKSGPKGDDSTAKTTPGDDLLDRLNLIRNRNPLALRSDPRHPELLAYRGLASFHETWTEWKDELQLLDFTDLLEECLLNVTKAPGDPRVMFGDETQDWSPLESLLFRDHWGQHAEKVILVGDFDQAIFVWRGADPRGFIDHPVPPENKILLSQSYRVPQAVRDKAISWIERWIHDREPVQYQARNHPGIVGSCPGTYRTPDDFRLSFDTCLAAGHSIMILGSCDYMLKPVIAWMRARGIPYANLYRIEERRWNPLRWGATRGVGGKAPEVTRLDRLLAYLAPSVELRGDKNREWTWEDIERWTEPLRSTGSKENAILAHGAKAKIKRKAKERKAPGHWTMQEFGSLFVGGIEGPIAQQAHKGDLDWWLSAMKPKDAEKYDYYLNIIRNHGQRALLDPPKVCVGTIHSVKGGEADTVILFPDISPAASEQWCWGPGLRDETVRLFYVAITRAKYNLILCQPANIQLHVPIGEGTTGFLGQWLGSKPRRPPEIEVRSELLT